MIWEFYAAFAACPEAAWHAKPDTGPYWPEIHQDSMDGRLAMMVQGDSMLPELRKAARFRVGAVPIPPGPDGRYHAMVGLAGIGTQAPHPEAGVRWIMHLVSRRGQQSLAEQKLHLPVHRDVAESDVWDDGRLVGSGAIARTTSRLRLQTRHYEPRQPLEVLSVRPLASRLFLGEISVAEAEEYFCVEHPRALAAFPVQTTLTDRTTPLRLRLHPAEATVIRMNK